MDSYLNFTRSLEDKRDEHPAIRVRPVPGADSRTRDHTSHWRAEDGKPSRWTNDMDAEKGTFNPRFPSFDDPRPRHKYLSSDDSDESPYKAPREHASDEALRGLEKVRTAQTVQISGELFEKLYLSPEQKVHGNLRSTFANPTPIGLLGFLLAGSPLACEMMGWRGAGGNGAALTGVYYFAGGFLMSLSGILEFFIGNTFSFVVFLSYGSFWFSLGGTLTPAFNAYGAYVENPGTNPNAGIADPVFHATYGFFLLFMALMSLIYLICALRTNLVFIAIFFGLTGCFVMDAGSYFQVANGNASIATKLQMAGGGFLFFAAIAGWIIFTAQLLASVDFPFEIPVGDISHFIKPLSEVKAAKSKPYTAR